MRRRFAHPTWYPSLHRRQVIAAIAAAARRASDKSNPPTVTIRDKQKPPQSGNREGLTNRTTRLTGSNGGRFAQSA